MSRLRPLSLGAIALGGGRCRFRLWAPAARRSVSVELVEPLRRSVPLAEVGGGYWQGEVEGVEPGSLYLYRLDDREPLPDPASRHQPRGVGGPSEVVAPAPRGGVAWCGLDLADYVLYEIHVGTFSAPGTFDGVVPHLDRLRDLGVTALELMPVGQFPGERNWGYDGVFPFAAQSSYGGPDGLRRLVAACHERRLAVVLDVVYNHLGPEGNRLGELGPYFSTRHGTPWGPALNFDGPGSDEVRELFVENALYWLTELSVDALRLDAVHAIVDTSERPFLADLGEAVEQQGRALGRRVYAIAESAHGSLAYLRPRRHGGAGLAAQWSDDFHHALHAVLTGERGGYYQDFGSLGQLAEAYREGFVYTGQRSAWWGRRHGVPTAGVAAERFVVYAQNHDQTGNRPRGERLASLVSFEQLKLAAGAVLLSPFLPLLFMGEEYGEEAPFLYFIHHADAGLVEAVREGRRRDFAAFPGWGGESLPDPQDEATFERSRPRRERVPEERRRALEGFYRELLRLRRAVPALAHLSRRDLEATADEGRLLLVLRRWLSPPAAASGERGEIVALFNFGVETVRENPPAGSWDKLLDSAEERWGGAGSALPPRLPAAAGGALELPPHTLVVYRRKED